MVPLTSTFDVDGVPPIRLHALHDADLLLVGLEDGTLLDVELKVRGHRGGSVARWDVS